MHKLVYIIPLQCFGRVNGIENCGAAFLVHHGRKTDWRSFKPSELVATWVGMETSPTYPMTNLIPQWHMAETRHHEIRGRRVSEAASQVVRGPSCPPCTESEQGSEDRWRGGGEEEEEEEERRSALHGHFVDQSTFRFRDGQRAETVWMLRRVQRQGLGIGDVR